MAEGHCSTGLQRRRCIGSIAPGGGLGPFVRRQWMPECLRARTLRPKGIDCCVGVVDGVGVIHQVNGLGLPLVGQFPPRFRDGLMEGRGEDPRECGVQVVGVASVKLGREFVGPAGGGRVAMIGTVGAATDDGSHLDPEGVSACLMASAATVPLAHSNPSVLRACHGATLGVLLRRSRAGSLPGSDRMVGEPSAENVSGGNRIGKCLYTQWHLPAFDLGGLILNWGHLRHVPDRREKGAEP